MKSRRILLIVNPAAGTRRGLAVARGAAAALVADGLSVEQRFSERPGHARELAAALEPGAWDAVGVVGGDGTLHEVANGLLDRGGTPPPIVLLPAGSGDSLARDLSIGDWREGLRCMVEGRQQAIDLARVELDGRALYALNLVGWGAIARIDHAAERLRWARGRRYDVAALRELARPRLARGGFRIEDEDEDPTLLGGAACVTRFVGNGLELAPDARLDDGLLDLVLLRAGGRLRLLSLLLAVQRGLAAAHPLLARRRLARIELTLAPGSPVVVDGEPLRATRLSIEVAPAALRVLAP